MKRFSRVYLIAGICCGLPLLVIGLIVLGGKAATGVRVGDRAPAFALTDFAAKKSFANGDLSGKPAILWFTTSYCVPCQVGAKEVKKLDSDMGDAAFNVFMVFIDPREEQDDLIVWKNAFGNPDWHIARGNEQMIRDYQIRFLDTQYLLDRDGIIRFTSNGFVGYEGYKNKIQALQ